MDIVFAGPSLPQSARPARPGLAFRPPAMQGDLHAAAKERPRAIALIDGYFESVAAVWHKEILWALSRGVLVWGASSMGALRAAELSQFGMVGVGRVFEYMCESLRDDADVALVHGPAELDYVNLSEAQVNVHFTLAKAVDEGVVDAEAAALVLQVSRDLFFKERRYELILRRARAAGLSAAAARALRAWLPANRVDQKRTDALLLLERLDQAEPGGTRAVAFEFQHTAMWEQAREYRWRRPGSAE
ncbi:MAG TPA: TfuA-like protein [Acetobacteraceae bacterium]|nr:TfuA-like protein [Acetobacteraceae bacterium]